MPGVHVVVRIPPVLRRFSAGAATVDVALPDGATVGDALRSLASEHPGVFARAIDEQGEVRRHVNVFVNADNVRDLSGLASPLADRDEVAILAAVSGG